MLQHSDIKQAFQMFGVVSVLLAGCASEKAVKHRIASCGTSSIPASAKQIDQQSDPLTSPIQPVAFTQSGDAAKRTDKSTTPNLNTDSKLDIDEEKSVVRQAKPPRELPTELPGFPSTITATVNSNDLDSFIAIAMANNPAIRQAEAAVCKAIGLRDQVVLKPNPVLGYNGSQLFDRQTDQHTMFVAQDFVRGNKLARNGHVLEHEIDNLRWQVEQQRRSVASDVKQSFYKVLGSQTQLELAKTFCQMAQQAVDLTKKRTGAGEGTELDVMQTEIQLQQLLISKNQTLAALNGAWQQLSAVTGIRGEAYRTVAGELPSSAATLDWEQELSRILAESPEIHAAESRVSRAIANLDRQQVQAIPNVSMQVSAGYDEATKSQLVNTQVGLPMPFHNRNQGNRSAAGAEYQRAAKELETTELAIRSRLGQTATAYQSAAATVEVHRTEILPRAERLLKLSEQAYRAGEADFLQVLSIRQTYYNSQLTYVAGRTDLAQAQAMLDELLLSNSLSGVTDTTLDDGLRGQTFSGQ